MTMESDLGKNSQVAAQLAQYATNFAQRFIPSLSAPGAASGFSGLASKSLTLVGPTQMNFDFDAAVGEEMGPFTAHLQGWFIRPVSITVHGESFLGTYTGISRSDGDIQNILENFKQSANEFTTKYGTPGTQEKIQLEFSNNPTGTSKYLGYMKHFSFGELITNPYMLPYEFTFIGRVKDGYQISKGHQYAAIAKQMNGGA